MPSLTAEPELESKEETRNTVLDFNDFPDLFYGYKKKPYTIDFMGKEVKYEREAYKLRVRKEDKTINGVQYADIFYCYIDVKLKVSIAQETYGFTEETKNILTTIRFSDYQNTGNGYLMPYKIEQTVDGKKAFEMIIYKVVINPQIASSEFKFPGN